MNNLSSETDSTNSVYTNNMYSIKLDKSDKSDKSDDSNFNDYYLKNKDNFDNNTKFKFIKQFDLNNLTNDNKILIIGGINTGKTTLMYDIIKHTQNLYEEIHLIGYKNIGDDYLKLNKYERFNNVNGFNIDKFIELYKYKDSESNKINKLIIFDNIVSFPEPINPKILHLIQYSHLYGANVIVMSQMPINFSKYNTHIFDYVFALNHPFSGLRDRICEHYYISHDTTYFEKIMNEICNMDMYNCVVIIDNYNKVSEHKKYSNKDKKIIEFIKANNNAIDDIDKNKFVRYDYKELVIIKNKIQSIKNKIQSIKLQI